MSLEVPIPVIKKYNGGLFDIWEICGSGVYVRDEMYRPEGEATLFVHQDELQLALVAYGYDRIIEGGADAEEDIVTIDGLLARIDSIKRQR